MTVLTVVFAHHSEPPPPSPHGVPVKGPRQGTVHYQG